MCQCKVSYVHVWLLVSTNNIILNVFFLQRLHMFIINFIDYSRYIYYFYKPWGCFVCICMCVIILKML